MTDSTVCIAFSCGVSKLKDLYMSSLQEACSINNTLQDTYWRIGNKQTSGNHYTVWISFGVSLIKKNYIGKTLFHTKM